MWIARDFDGWGIAAGTLPIKVLKGTRQVGKTSVLERLKTHQVVYLDDVAARTRALADPRGFLDRLAPRLNHVRSKEKVEIELLVHLSNGRTLAVDVKSAAGGFDRRQLRLLDTRGLDVVERRVVTPDGGQGDPTARVVPFTQIWHELDRLEP